MSNFFIINNDNKLESCEPIVILGSSVNKEAIQDMLYRNSPLPCNEYNPNQLSCPNCGCILEHTDDGNIEGDFCTHCGQRVFVTTDDLKPDEVATVLCQRANLTMVVSKKCQTTCRYYEECLAKSKREKVNKR